MRATWDTSTWLASYLTWMRERSAETIEIVTDVSSELYLNSLMAQHLRVYAREKGWKLFWARCEWGKTDITFGELAEKLGDGGDAWNKAWKAKQTGDLGQIEAKILYSHLSPSSWGASFETLESQLANRRLVDERAGIDSVEYLGAVWTCAYDWSSPMDLEPLWEKHGFGPPVGGGDIGTLEVDTVWPSEGWGTATLSLSLRPWVGKAR